MLAIAEADLDARIARAENRDDEEIAHFRMATELQDKLSYMEPPEWHYPVREALGGALLRDGKPAEAEAVFRKDLELHPRNGRSLFGLLESLKAQGKSESAEWVNNEFREAWKYATTQLEVNELQGFSEGTRGKRGFHLPSEPRSGPWPRNGGSLVNARTRLGAETASPRRPQPISRGPRQ